eukprot:1302877-Prymnesium_polylepis.2
MSHADAHILVYVEIRFGELWHPALRLTTVADADRRASWRGAWQIFAPGSGEHIMYGQGLACNRRSAPTVAVASCSLTIPSGYPTAAARCAVGNGCNSDSCKRSSARSAVNAHDNRRRDALANTFASSAEDGRIARVAPVAPSRNWLPSCYRACRV